METVTKMLMIEGRPEPEARPNGDWFFEWLELNHCLPIIRKGIYQLSENDVAQIRIMLHLPLSKAEHIFLSDVRSKENGLSIQRVGKPERLIALHLIKIQDNIRLKAEKYTCDDRVKFVVGIK